jgi:putative glutamine amidotransferase
MRPLIAVAARRATKSSVLRFSGSIAAEAVCDAVLRAGGEPVILHGGAGPGRAVPALAICRGLQVLNVACGGTLRQHVAGGPVEHRGGLHEVTIARGTRLSRLAGADTITVSSYHHQAIGRLGSGLHAIACAPDGCVEAVEHTAAGILAVQWHPEDQAATRPCDQALFDDLTARALVAAAAGR